MVSITLQPVGLGLFTAPPPIVPSLHRLKPSICKHFKPLASLSYAITLLPVGLGLFTAPSTIVPSLHRLKPSICKLFKPLASAAVQPFLP